ncbi:MAG: protein kinase [Planctomycetes bacterium]|nr:protein kinase [Planctomycetota bacterium]
MDALRWQRLQAVVADALERLPEERAALVHARLRGEEDLIREALELLDEDTRASRRIEPAPGGGLASLLEEPDRDPWIGRTLERWRVLERLGAGGMGAVYLVERADGVSEQRAALKLLHASLAATEAARARFRAERRLLARIEHPGIARFVDGGVSAEGLPFLVVEHVAGLPIDRHCAQRGLGLRERVALFASVCDAVAAAHAAQVVHRDLKPSNVLVDAQGRPRLVDFGISKLLEDDGPGAPLTETGARAMTPRYASPEQIAGGPVRATSDVYSLGVVLYELLAGRSPYDLSRLVSPARVEESVCRTEPERPSTAATRAAPREASDDPAVVRDRARWAHGLAGDLDTIVLKALSKDPARRYATAGELGQDLRRWLAHEPVSARPDSTAYRAARYVRRNRALVAGTALAVVSLALGAAWALVEARAARAAARGEGEARAQAEARATQTQELVRALIHGVHDRIAPLAGATEVRAFLARETLAHVERLVGAGPLPSALRDDLADVLMRLGEVQGAWTKGSLGDVDGARASTLRALELLEEALREAPEDPLRLGRAAAAQRQLGDLERIAGRGALALERYARQRELAERALRVAPDDPRARREAALALGQAGRVLLDLGRPSEALAPLGEALRVAELSCGEQPAWSESALDAVLRGHQLGAALTALGRAREALVVQRRALERVEAGASVRPEDAQLAATRASSRTYLADTRLALGDLAGAEVDAQAGLEIVAPLRAAAPGDAFLLYLELQLHERLGQVELARQDPRAALAPFAAARELAAARRAMTSGDRAAARDLARVLTLEGTARARLGQPDAAASAFRAALEALGEPEDAAATEIDFLCRLELGDIEGARDGGERQRARLEELLELARTHTSLFAELDWPWRNRGLVAWKLGTLVEDAGSDRAASRARRVLDLEHAEQLYDEGHAAALRLESAGQLRPHEVGIPAAFRADVERCKAAALRLGDSTGS